MIFCRVSCKFIEYRPVPNVSRALEGAIPNLNISYSDGKPATNPVYNIRAIGDIHVTDWLTLTSKNVFSSLNYTDPFNAANIWTNLFGVPNSGQPLCP